VRIHQYTFDWHGRFTVLIWSLQWDDWFKLSLTLSSNIRMSDGYSETWISVLIEGIVSSHYYMDFPSLISNSLSFIEYSHWISSSICILCGALIGRYINVISLVSPRIICILYSLGQIWMQIHLFGCIDFVACLVIHIHRHRRIRTFWPKLVIIDHFTYSFWFFWLAINPARLYFDWLYPLPLSDW